MTEQQQPLTSGEFNRTMDALGTRIDALTDQVRITNGRVLALERMAERESQKVLNLEREVFQKRSRGPAVGRPVDGDAKPLTRWDLTVAVAVIGAVLAVLAFIGKVKGA